MAELVGMEQFYGTREEAVTRDSRAEAEEFLEKLRARGYLAFEAPPLPPANNVEEGKTVLGVRVLVTWIPDWHPHPQAGKWARRLDTLAEKR